MASPNGKTVVMIAPVTTAITDGATQVGFVDTRGYDYLEIDFTTNTVTASDVPVVLKLGEDDTSTAVTDMTDITEFVGGGVGGFTIPITAQTVVLRGYNVKFGIDLRGGKRKRYIGISHEVATTVVPVVVARLSKADEATIAADADMLGYIIG